MNDRKTIDYFNRYYEPSRRHQQAMAAQWNEYEKAYLGEPEAAKPSGIESWRSFFHFKYGYQQVQVLAAEVASDDDPTFVFEGRSPMQDEYAQTAQSIISYQLQRDDYVTKRLLAAMTAAVYGGCPIKVSWLYECVKRPVLKPSGLIEESKIVLLDQPSITLIDPRDFYYDTRARSMKECRYVFHRMRLTIEELESKKRSDGSPFYKNLDELRRIIEGDGSSDDVQRDLDNDYAGERDKARREGIEVIEMWTKDRVIVRAAGGTIIRDDPNPYLHGRLPFEVVTLQPSLNDVWGMSVMWLLRDIQQLLWTLDNASADALKMLIDPPLAVDITADPENISKALFPGQRFAGRGEARQIMEPLRVTGVDMFASDATVKAQREQMEYITGITREMAGLSQADTATQAALNQRQAKGRVGIMLRVVDTAFARCAEMMLQLNQQYLNLAQPIKLLGPKGSEWRNISPKEIAGIWDVRAKNASERVVEELRRQNLMEGLAALQPMNGLVTPTGKTVNYEPFIKELAESFKMPSEQILVPAQMLYDQQRLQAVAEATAMAEAQKILPPEPQQQQATPEQPVDPFADAQSKLFQSINYKDMPDAAQARMLEALGLPSDGVEDDNRNPTRPNAGVNPISEGLKAHSSAKKASSGSKS